MTNEEYMDSVRQNSNATMLARDSYTSKIIPNSTLLKNAEEAGPYSAYNSPHAFNPDLNTTAGLYKVAHSVGLGDQANSALTAVGGEKSQFFSGGFVSDIMDVLNIGSYGMVGLLKGKSFQEGVKNRESFSSEDSLGQYGLVGSIAGMALDIAVDPFTYVAPWKIISKVPGVARTLEMATTRALGEFKTFDIGGGRELQQRIGGWNPLNFLGNKLVYGYALDTKFMDGFQKIQEAAGTAQQDAEGMLGLFSKMDPKVTANTLQFTAAGRQGRVPLEELYRTMDSKVVNEQVKPMYDFIDGMADKLVEGGALPASAKEAYINSYLTQSYDYVLAKRAETPIKGKSGINASTEQKGAKVFTPEQREAMGLVQDAPVVLGTTMMKQIELKRKMDLQNLLSQTVAMDQDQMLTLARESGKDASKDFHLVQGTGYAINKSTDTKVALKKVNDSIDSILEDRKVTVGDHKDLLREIEHIKATVGHLAEASEEKVGEAISGFRHILTEAGVKTGPAKKVPTGEGQNAIATDIKKWLGQGKKADRLERETMSSSELLNSYRGTHGGLVFDRAFEDPQMMYQWKTPEEFFDAIRYPNRSVKAVEAKDTLSPISEAASDSRIKKSEEMQRKIGKLQNAKEILESTNLPLVQEHMENLEQAYADHLFKKNNLIELLNTNELGNLQGKYVPKEMWEMVKGTFEPQAQFGEKAVIMFKHAKVIWNPAAYPKNLLGGMVANWWKLGLGPWRADQYVKSYMELKNGSQYVDRMKAAGWHETNGVLGELRDTYMSKQFLDTLSASKAGTAVSTIRTQSKRLDKWMQNTYGHIDNISKLAAFKHGIGKGLSDEDALKAAYTATFNYNQVTPFVHQMRQALWGVPFITFNLKAVPLALETLRDAPHRISAIGKARTALFEASGIQGEQENESMPAYMRDDQFNLRLPWKDAQGRSMYYDMTYLIPFGAIMDGEYLKNPIGTNPVLQTIKELSQNKTFSGNKIFLESDDTDTVVRDIALHTMKLMMPPAMADALPKGYRNDGTRVMGTFDPGNTQDLGPGERNYFESISKMAGFNVSPYDLGSKERQFDYQRKDALQQLLVQHGVLKDFSKLYVPKEDKGNLYDKRNPDNIKSTKIDKVDSSNFGITP